MAIRKNNLSYSSSNRDFNRTMWQSIIKVLKVHNFLAKNNMQVQIRTVKHVLLAVVVLLKYLLKKNFPWEWREPQFPICAICIKNIWQLFLVQTFIYLSVTTQCNETKWGL